MLTRGKKRLSDASDTTAVDEEQPALKQPKLDAPAVDGNASNRPPVYTVKIRDETFLLTDTEIHFDGPSYFTMALSRDWAEGESRSIEIINRSPALFRM